MFLRKQQLAPETIAPKILISEKSNFTVLLPEPQKGPKSALEKIIELKLEPSKSVGGPVLSKNLQCMRHLYRVQTAYTTQGGLYKLHLWIRYVFRHFTKMRFGS